MAVKKEPIVKGLNDLVSVEQDSVMCGIIMPIADNSEYPNGHWQDVLGIVKDALKSIDIKSRLVSDDVSVGLIHERIVTNIYEDDIVICDVSSKNPNVMFELGMRLAFDKPTIIIKDERTAYSFDTGPIEHLNYPSTLRFTEIVKFKENLISKILGTLEKHKADPNYSPFLKSFGRTIVPAKINQTEIPISEYVIDKLDKISRDLDFVYRNRIKGEREVFKYNNRINSDGTDDLKKIFDNSQEALSVFKKVLNPFKNKNGGYTISPSILNDIILLVRNLYPEQTERISNTTLQHFIVIFLVENFGHLEFTRDSMMSTDIKI